MLEADQPGIDRFLGLNNVTDPLRAGFGWLTTADNVNVTDTGALEARSGYSRVAAGNYTGAYSTKDFQRMYLVESGLLKTGDGAILKSGISSAAMYWTEINGQVFFNNGKDSGLILPDNTVLDWRWDTPATPTLLATTGSLPAGTYQVLCIDVKPDGRETGASNVAEITLVDGQALQITGLSALADVYIAPANSTVFQYAGSGSTAFVWNSGPENLGRDLLNNFLDPLPTRADVVQAWKGRIYAAEYLPSDDQTVVWFSEPLGYHLFNLNSNFILIPGRVHMLAPTDEALVIGTDRKIFAYNIQSLNEVADYGVVPGQHWAEDEGRTLFWTKRGVCSALPFSNLTEKSVSVAPGIQAGGTIVRQGGQKRYVVALQQGGLAFNSL